MPERSTRSMVSGPAVAGASGVTLLARIRGQSGQLVTPASVSSIAYAVTDLDAGLVLGTGTFAASTVLSGLVQGDPRWAADSPSSPGADGASGYNWAATLPASLFAVDAPAAPVPPASQALPRRIRCDVAFTPVSGEPFRVAFQWEASRAYG